MPNRKRSVTRGSGAKADLASDVKLLRARPHAFCLRPGDCGYDMGSVERALGMLAAVRGDTSFARDHFDTALRQHRQIGARLLAEGSLRDGGRGLSDTAMLDEAQSLDKELGLARAADAIDTTHDPRGERRATNIFRLEGGVVGRPKRHQHATARHEGVCATSPDSWRRRATRCTSSTS